MKEIKLRYLSGVPTKRPKNVPAGHVLVHNFRPTSEQATALSLDGFRAWFAAHDPKIQVLCGCPFAPRVRAHYTTKAHVPTGMRATRKGFAK